MVGVNKSLKEDLLKLLDIEMWTFPFRYLGIPLHSTKLGVVECKALTDKITSKINQWSSKLLSNARRVEIIKSVIGGIVNFWSQIFYFPTKVIKMINDRCRSFIWAGKGEISMRVLIYWDKMCKPRDLMG